jgi:hypothetical protein
MSEAATFAPCRATARHVRDRCYIHLFDATGRPGKDDPFQSSPLPRAGDSTRDPGHLKTAEGCSLAWKTSKPMLININGWPGSGKLTVARIVAQRLNARLLDNHTILNVASAVTKQGTPQFYETARAVRRIAFDRILELPAHTPVVLTTWSLVAEAAAFWKRIGRPSLSLPNVEAANSTLPPYFAHKKKTPEGLSAGNAR